MNILKEWIKQIVREVLEEEYLPGPDEFDKVPVPMSCIEIMQREYNQKEKEKCQKN